MTQSNDTPRRERRRFRRQGLNHPVTIAWEASAGRIRSVKGNVVDWSETGLRVTTTERLAERSFVQLRTMHHVMLGTVSVRYCDRQGAGFMAGLEFMGGLKWNEHPFRGPGEASRS